MAIYIFLFSHLKELLRLYIILFDLFFVSNILIERNEMSAIFNFCRYACHVTTGVTQYFYLDKHQSFCTQNYTLSALRNIKITQKSKPLKHLPINIWSATNTFICFIWLIPVVTCDVIKTTVNEIKNVSKMADISLLQVKIFQELSTI